MLEGACLAVEGAAKGGGVYPEVLFSVARCWYELFEIRNRHQVRQGTRRASQRQLVDAAPSQQGQEESLQPGQQPQLAQVEVTGSNLNLPVPPLPPTLPPVVATTGTSALPSSQQQQQTQISAIENVTHLHPPVGTRSIVVLVY